MWNIITRNMVCVLVLCFVFRSTHYLAASSAISLTRTFFFSKKLESGRVCMCVYVVCVYVYMYVCMCVCVCVCVCVCM